MKELFLKNKGRSVLQNGHKFIVAGYTPNQIIGATTMEIEKRTWKKLDKGSFVEKSYEEMNFCYIDSALID